MRFNIIICVISSGPELFMRVFVLVFVLQSAELSFRTFASTHCKEGHWILFLFSLPRMKRCECLVLPGV